jgi:glycerophosphoryl diester phosphodiesterase
MKLLKDTFSEFGAYWIVEGKNYKSKDNLKETIRMCNSAKLDGLDVQARKYLNKDVIHLVKNSGLKIYTWTVDDPERAQQLHSDGIDGITTNRAGWLKNKLIE